MIKYELQIGNDSDGWMKIGVYGTLDKAKHEMYCDESPVAKRIVSVEIIEERTVVAEMNFNVEMIPVQRNL